ncbi:hypothetical protein DPEC_G00252560 [Dallia pectoralis]|uniref:Uncharacterized protein n=1 Tax=Dallia pectoralis TaxID=75939 RepID=A0ACC2FTR6_DALPE|nr:hypothetical protein DPEC_G00252560 [Dallia pectoralis]
MSAPVSIADLTYERVVPLSHLLVVRATHRPYPGHHRIPDIDLIPDTDLIPHRRTSRWSRPDTGLDTGVS